MRQITRREFIKYSAMAGFAALAGLAGLEILVRPSPGTQTTQTGTTQATSGYQPPSGAPPEYAEFLNWLHGVSRPYAGVTQSVSLEYEFLPLALQKIDPDFFNATGINNEYSLKPYGLHLADISLMASTRAPTYDVYNVDSQDVGSFVNDIMSPTELADTYPDLTFQGFSSSDFWDIPWSQLTTYPPAPYQSGSPSGDILFLPFDMATMAQFYRSDIFASKGLSPARTWDDYILNAKSANGPNVPFGTVNEASPDISIVFEFLNILQCYGGSLWEVQGGEILTGLGSDAALAALEKYIGLSPYSNPSSYTFSWPDIASTLYHSLAGQAIEFEEYAPWMDDVTRSLVVQKIGYAPTPAGPSGSFSTFGGSGVGVSRFSRHPETAWLWLQWATALGTQKAAVKDYFHPFPSRKGVLDDTSVTQSIPSSQLEALMVTKQTWELGNVATLVPFPKWFDVLDPISFYLNQAWRGSLAPKDALSAAVQKIDSWGTLSF